MAKLTTAHCPQDIKVFCHTCKYLSGRVGRSSAYVCCSRVDSGTFIRFILFHGFISIAMIIIGLRIRGKRKCFQAFLTLYISGFLVGGIFEWIYQYAGAYIEVGGLFLILAIACYYLASGVLWLLTKMLRFGAYHCQVTLVLGENQCKTQAIVDTGNHLTNLLAKQSA